ncbi:MAG TPA: DUF6264 family protein [Microbacteriaceae bacterium]|nr:DUF6264 family protein [Microbacteriaceae bacterium]
MNEQRPRPQFGEYATREEQLARIQSPSPEQLEPSVPAAGPTPARGAERRAPIGRAAVDPAILAASRRRVNMFGTVAFLAYGFIEVVSSVPMFLSFNLFLNDVLTLWGQTLGVEFATYPATSLAGAAGVGLAGFWVLMWMGAVLFAWRRLRSGRSALWVPISAGLVVYVVTSVVIVSVLLRDPTIAAQLAAAVSGGSK